MIMYPCSSTPRFFFLKDPPPTEFYPLPLHDALPICLRVLAIVLADDRHGALPGGHVPARGGAVIGGGGLVKGLEPDAGGFRDAHVLADERDEHLLHLGRALDHLLDVRGHGRGGHPPRARPR